MSCLGKLSSEDEDRVPFGDSVTFSIATDLVTNDTFSINREDSTLFVSNFDLDYHPRYDFHLNVGCNRPKQRRMADSVYIFQMIEVLNDTNHVADSAMLTQLYNSTGGENWTTKENWLDYSMAFDKWEGVSTGTYTNGKKRVTKIELPYNNLNGPIDFDFTTLTTPDWQVTTFDVSNNGSNLTGTIIDEVGDFLQLDTLKLGNNGFTGDFTPPSVIDNLTNLIYLDLSSNEFGLQSSPDISSLSALKHLDFSSNQFTSFPAISSLTSLEYVDLSENEIGGTIPNISQLTLLEYVDLSKNEIGGELPNISPLGAIQNLDVSFNSLQGNIEPIDLSNSLTSLDSIDLSYNAFEGEVPKFHTGLQKLVISRNKFNEFADPTSVSGAAQLVVNADSNYFDFNDLYPVREKLDKYSPQALIDEPDTILITAGSVDTINVINQTLPEGTTTYSWYKIDEATNNVEPRTPPVINDSNYVFNPFTPASDTGLYYVEVTSNVLTLSNLTLYSDTITVIENTLPTPPVLTLEQSFVPDSFYTANDTIFIYENVSLDVFLGKLSSEDEDRVPFGDSVTFSIATNKITNDTFRINRDDSTLFVSNFDLDYTQDTTYTLTLLATDQNKGVADSVYIFQMIEVLNDTNHVADSAMLTQLYNSTGGENWTARDNWLDYSMPFDKWEGVSTGLYSNGKKRVTKIELPDNNLIGQIDFDFTTLTTPDWQVTTFDVSDNGSNLTGTIIDEVGGFSLLDTLKLGNNRFTGDITSLSGINNLGFLEYLDLSSNAFGEQNSPNISSLSALKHLDFSTNQFTSFPAISNLTNLEYVDISENEILGTTPDISQLTLLEYVDLSKNEIDGTIPDISQLVALQYLDVSFNSLQGNIEPIDLSNSLTSLDSIDLSYNDFRGKSA